MTEATTEVLPAGRRGDAALSLITVDMDGVLCEPPLGRNITAHGPIAPPEVLPPPSRMKRLLWYTEPVRYIGRRCMPGAERFLRELAADYRLILVTARGRAAAPWTRRWLRRSGLWPYLDGLAFRIDPQQPPYAYKAATVAQLRPAWHIEDDGRTAMHVAHKAGCPVVLLAWPQNAGEYPPEIHRVAGFPAALRLLRSG